MIFLKNSKNIYTDLAIEAHEMAEQSDDGVSLQMSQYLDGNVIVTNVSVTNENGAQTIGKPIGNYVTIESKLLSANDKKSHEEITKILAKTLVELCNLDKSSSALIIGLGNWNVTPDALGPRAVGKVLVTRHLTETDALPVELESKLRQVAAISPGVLGITGIETLEIVKGIADKIKPSVVIAIDALAARNVSRINTTIQVSDAGISPGAGLGNKRKQLNEETVGTKVVAIGVPTVISAATLVSDTLDSIIYHMRESCEKGSELYDVLEDMENEDRHSLISQMLMNYKSNMFVTPKEVDDVIDRLSTIIAHALNMALCEGIDADNVLSF